MRKMTREMTTAPVAVARPAFSQRFLRWCVPDIHAPRGWKQWLTVSSISTVFSVVVFLTIIAPRCWGWGLMRPDGNSLADIFPQGSVILSLPLTIHDGDFVTAYGRLDGPKTVKDLPKGIMVKQFKSGRLVSTYNGEASSNFQITGKVIASIPLQRVFPWLDTGMQNPIPGYHEPTPEEKGLAINALKYRGEKKERFLKSGDREWKTFDEFKLTGNGKRVISKKIIFSKSQKCAVGVITCGSAGGTAEIWTSNNEGKWCLIGTTQNTNQDIQVFRSSLEIHGLKILLRLSSTGSQEDVSIIGVRPLNS